MSNRRLLIIAAAALFCVAPISANEPVGSVRGIMGTVKVLTPRDRNANPDDPSTWPDARLNMPLREKDMVATLRESEARLETVDGSTVRLRESTTLEVAALKGNANAVNARFRVNDGSVVANVKRVADALGGGNRSRIEIQTPTSLAAIRGTTVEVESRRAHGTTIKTFDGQVQVAPAGGKNFADMGDYQMTEVAPGQRNAKVRAVPRNYRPRTTKLLNEEETAALTGFTRVILTFAELEEIQRRLESDGIASAIGIGESDNEMTARTVSSDVARAELAKAMETQVQRLSESYAQNIGGEARKIWEEGVRQITNVSVRGSSVHSTITQYNPELKRFKVYSLMLINPDLLKTSVAGTVDKMEEESELRVKKDELMSRMDASINALNTKYHDR